MLYEIWKPCVCILWNNCLLISLCPVSHFSPSISPRTQRIDTQWNRVKVFWEMLRNNLSVIQHREYFLGWGFDLFLFAPYNENLWIFSTIIFGKIWEQREFPANSESSLSSGCTASNHYLGESLIQDVRIQPAMKRWKGKGGQETKENGRALAHLAKSAT